MDKNKEQAILMFENNPELNNYDISEKLGINYRTVAAWKALWTRKHKPKKSNIISLVSDKRSLGEALINEIEAGKKDILEKHEAETIALFYNQSNSQAFVADIIKTLSPDTNAISDENFLVNSKEFLQKVKEAVSTKSNISDTCVSIKSAVQNLMTYSILLPDEIKEYYILRAKSQNTTVPLLIASLLTEIATDDLESASKKAKEELEHNLETIKKKKLEELIRGNYGMGK